MKEISLRTNQKTGSFIKTNKLILLIIILSLLFYLLNPLYGNPVLYVSGDEPPNYMGALYMMVNKNPFVKTSIYPPLGSYIQIPFLGIAFITFLILGKMQNYGQLRLFLVTNQGYFLFIPRIISGVLGSITIIYIYKISKLLFRNKYLSLISSLLFLFSFNHGQMSNSGRPWSPAIFFFTVSIYFSLKSIISKINIIRYLVFAGLFAAFSFGCHQIGIFSLFFLVYIRIINNYDNKKTVFIDIYTIIGFCIGLFGIIFFQVMRINAPSTEWFAITNQYFNSFEKFKNILISGNIFYNLKQIIITEPIIFIFFILNLKLIKRSKLIYKFIILFIICLFIIIGFSFRQPRYQLPVIMLMTIFAANSLWEYYKNINNIVYKIIYVLIMIFLSSNYFIVWSYLYIKKPTFVQAQEWIDNNISRNVGIVSTASRFMPYTPSKNFIKLQQIRHSNYYQAAYNYLNFGEYPTNVRDIIYLGELGDIHKKENVPFILKNIPVKYYYLIDIYFDPFETPLKTVDKSKYEKIVTFNPFNNKQSKIKFDNLLTTIDDPWLPLILYKLERTGPYIDIYKIKD